MNKPKGTRIDAGLFRTWLSRPYASEGLVGDFPSSYATEIRNRTDDGEQIPRTVGVRAALALEAADITSEDQFVELLTDIRSDAQGSQISGAELKGVHEIDIAGATATELSEVHDELQNSGGALGEALEQAAVDARAGRALSPTLGAQLDSWRDTRHSLWEMLHVVAPPVSAGLEQLAELRDRVAAKEAAEQAAEDAQLRSQLRDQLTGKLGRLRRTIETLEEMLDGESTYQGAYDTAVRELAETEAELEALDAHSDSGSSESPSTPAGPVSKPSVAPVPKSEAVQESGPSPAPVPKPEAVQESGPSPAPVPKPEPVQESELTPEIDLGSVAGHEAERNFTGGTRHDDRPESPARPRVVLQRTADTALHDAEPSAATALAGVPADVHNVDRDRVALPRLDVSEYLVDHVRAGHYGAAWLVASAAHIGAADVAAYRLAAGAFNSGPGGADPAEVLVEFTLAGDSEYGSSQSARVALAAALRAGLTAGWMPRSEVEELVRQASLDDRGREVVAAAVAAGDRNYQHLQDFGGQIGPSVDEVRIRAREIKQQLDQQRITFTRADKALRYLMRSTKALGSSLAAVQATSSGTVRRGVLNESLTVLNEPDNLIADADNTMSSGSRRRDPITGHARTTLLKAIDQVRDCVTDAVNAAEVAAGDTSVALTQDARHALITAAKAARDSGIATDADGPGDVALANLVEWILDPQPPRRVPDGQHQVLVTESLPVVAVTRTADGLPVATTGDVTAIVEALTSPPSAGELFAAYVDRGDLQQAAAVAVDDPALYGRIDPERSRWRRRLDKEVAAVRAEIGRTFADDFTYGEHADAESRLVQPAGYSGDRFDLQIAELEKLRVDLHAHREQVASRLTEQVDAEVVDSAARADIAALIADEDFVGANELLALARTGQLSDITPDVDPDTGAAVFVAFMDALESLDNERVASIRDVVGQMAAGAQIAADELSRLNNWDNLLARKNNGQRGRQATMASVLRALGLDMRGEANKQAGSGKHFDLYRITATPVDGSLVPGLGSKASHYMVAVTSEAKLLKQTLASAFPAGPGSNIVLFAGVLTADQRRQCLVQCRSEKITAIVIDFAVAAYIAIHHARKFRAVQQLTLPFSCFTHYTMVSGQVPDEVFVGRAQEQTQLADPYGSQFVYGGRQLGKSALLRRIERVFNGIEDQHAIYIDLNASGIGSWAESNQLWNVLYNKLVEIGSFGLKLQPNVRNHEPVIKAIASWLAGKDSRRLLLLLDEADAFLEKESVAGAGGFKNVGPLKGLFDNSHGRFKPVFAGLHKVQRLQNVANTPLAHGGTDILIGPLGAKPARDLVIKPLEALGYRFDNPEAVWRLLAFTNMQPGLIQVVCNDLIEHLQSRPLHRGEPLVTISDTDINAVTQNPTTREKIANKLRLTIQLEDRYKVIALGVAIESMDSGFTERYRAADIRALCEVYWPDGFADLNSTEFVVYLDELIGLGVLTKNADNRYSVRSPNIVTMLGSRDELATQLDEDKFELEPEYNPRSTRRQETIAGRMIRSPLSEQDLIELIPMRDRHPAHNFAVIGSEALGVGDVAPILAAVASKRHTNATVIDATSGHVEETLTGFKFATGGGGKKPSMLIIDAHQADVERAAAIATAAARLASRPQGHLIVIYGVDGVDAADEAATSAVPTTVIALDKWSGDGIRSWHDNPFLAPEDRRELLENSGGWPDLVEQAVTDVVNRGVSHTEEWEKLSAFPANPIEAAAFLDRVGVGEHTRNLLAQWSEYGVTDYEPVTDIADVLERDPDDMRVIMRDLRRLGVVNERDDEFLLDPVVARAVTALE
ncbi:UNVERIFIED_CONTAM: hypothetical protein DES50_108194 [Williamsia faeni]